MEQLHIDNKSKVELFFKLRNVQKITEWEDIKVGETYHLPPLVYNKRMDFVVVEKSELSMRVRKLSDNYYQTMFKGDITSNFIVKKWCIDGEK